MVGKKLGIIFLASVILTFFAGFFAQRILPSSPQSNSGDMFNYIVNSFKNYYYYDIDNDEVHQAFIATMEAAVNKIAEENNDPYTRLVATPIASAPSDDEKFIGLGVSFLFEALNLRVNYVYPTGGAHLRLYPNDLVVGIVNHDETLYFKDMVTEEKVLSYLTGTLDETKQLIIKNPDGVETMVSIIYQEVLTPTVYTKNIEEEDIAYVKIERFSGYSESSVGTASVFQNLLYNLENTTLNGEGKTLIIDLRDNPGGALTALHNQGVSSLIPGIAQQLLPRNIVAPLFTMIPRSGTVQVFEGALSQLKPYDIKVLVNEHSASAAEVLAAALQSRGGYELYGRPTYGKGVYQNQLRLSDINGIRYSLIYTEGQWYYGDSLNVSTTPLDVNLINNTGIKSLDMPVYEGLMSYDHVYQSLVSYQKFLNLYYHLTGIDKLREDGYFDSRTRDVVFQFNTEHEISSQSITIDTARMIHKIYMEYMNDYTKDDELLELITIIKSH